MKCREARKFLAAFVDDELDVRTNVEVLEHVQICRGCAARVERLQLLAEAVASCIESVHAHEGFRDRLFDAVGTQEAAPRGLQARLHRLAGSRWFAVTAAAASILVVFGAVYRFLVVAPAGYNSRAVLVHMQVIQDKISTMFSTSDVERAKRLALFTMDAVPEVPFLGADDFELIGAGPEEIEAKTVGHFVFRYRGSTVSMFVFEGLVLDEIRGRDVLTALGPAKADKRGDCHLLAWRRGSFAYVLVSRMPMAGLVEMVGHGKPRL